MERTIIHHQRDVSHADMVDAQPRRRIVAVKATTTTNGNLTHATVGRPTIPSNRRRQPTIERGLFAGVAVPVIELEELNKEEIVALRNKIAQTGGGKSATAASAAAAKSKSKEDDTAELMESISAAAAAVLAGRQTPKPIEAKEIEATKLPVISPVTRKEAQPKRFFASDDEEERDPVSPTIAPLSPSKAGATKKRGILSAFTLRSPRAAASASPPTTPPPAPAQSKAVVAKPRQGTLRSFFMLRRRTKTSRSRGSRPDATQSRGQQPVPSMPGEPLKTFRETAVLSSASSTSTLVSSSASSHNFSVTSPNSKDSRSLASVEAPPIDLGDDVKTVEDADDDRWWEQDQPRSYATSGEQRELLRCTAPTMTQSGLRKIDTLAEEESNLDIDEDIEEKEDWDAKPTAVVPPSATAVSMKSTLVTIERTEVTFNKEEALGAKPPSVRTTDNDRSVLPDIKEISHAIPTVTVESPLAIQTCDSTVKSAEAGETNSRGEPPETEPASNVNTSSIASSIVRPTRAEPQQPPNRSVAASPLAAFLSTGSNIPPPSKTKEEPSFRPASPALAKVTESRTVLEERRGSPVPPTSATGDDPKQETTPIKKKSGRVLALASNFDPAKKAAATGDASASIRRASTYVQAAVSGTKPISLQASFSEADTTSSPPKTANTPSSGSASVPTLRQSPVANRAPSITSGGRRPSGLASPLSAFIAATSTTAPAASTITSKEAPSSSPLTSFITQTSFGSNNAAASATPSPASATTTTATESPLKAFLNKISPTPEVKQAAPPSSTADAEKAVAANSKVKALREKFQPKPKPTEPLETGKGKSPTKPEEPELYSPLKAFLAMVEPQPVVVVSSKSPQAKGSNNSGNGSTAVSSPLQAFIAQTPSAATKAVSGSPSNASTNSSSATSSNPASPLQAFIAQTAPSTPSAQTASTTSAKAGNASPSTTSSNGNAAPSIAASPLQTLIAQSTPSATSSSSALPLSPSLKAPPPSSSPLSAFVQRTRQPSVAAPTPIKVVETKAESPLQSFLGTQQASNKPTAGSESRKADSFKPSPIASFLSGTAGNQTPSPSQLPEKKQSDTSFATQKKTAMVASEKSERLPLPGTSLADNVKSNPDPDEEVQVHGEQIRTQYILPLSKSKAIIEQGSQMLNDEPQTPAQRKREGSAHTPRSMMTARMTMVQSSARRSLLTRSSSSPSIRSSSPAATGEESPRTRLRKISNPPVPSKSENAESPRTRLRKVSSPPAPPSFLAKHRSHGEGTGSHATKEGVKSVSLKDFSLKETLQAYQKSVASPPKQKSTDELDGEFVQTYDAGADDEDPNRPLSGRRRPSMVKSLSLKDVSLKESLSIYQTASSRSMVRSLKRQSGERPAVKKE